MRHKLHEAKGQTHKGVFYIIFAGFLFAVASACVKILSAELPTLTVVFWRNTVGFAIFLLYLLSRGVKPRALRTQNMHLHLMRAVFTCASLLAYFYALSQIHLANAVLLRFTAPVFMPLLAFLIFRRVSDKNVWLGIFISLSGVAVMLEPQGMQIAAGEIAGLAAGLFAASALITLWLMASSDSADAQIFWLTTFCFLLALLLLPWVLRAPFWPRAEMWLPLLVLGGFTTFGHFCLSKGFALATGDKVGTWNYSAVVFAFIIGALWWGETPGLAFFIGVVLVVAGAHLSTLERKQRPSALQEYE